MKKQLFSIFAFSILFVSIVSCEGPVGPKGDIGPSGPAGAAGATGATGATGPAGQNGTNGTNGTNGVDGKIEAKSTGWLSFDFEGGKSILNSSTYNGIDKYVTYVTLYLKDKTQPFFTREVLDKGLILTYFKFNALVFNENDSDYSLQERITGGAATNSINSYFKIEGRTSSKSEDFTYCYLGNSEIAENYWNPYFNIQTPYVQSYVNNQYIYTSKAPELLDKSASFYRDLAKKVAPKMRLVVIPLSAAGRVKSLDWSN